MARILSDGQWYEQVESSCLSEAELEERILLHAPSVYPDYYVLPFKVTLDSEFGRFTPDLAFISTDYDEWKVVEVEMSYHSFNGHVENQVQRMSGASYGEKEARYLHAQKPSMDYDKILALITAIPPMLLVIVDAPQPSWAKQLSNYGANVAVFELFKSINEKEIFRVDGEYPTRDVSNISTCTPHPYSDRLLRVHRPDELELAVGAKIRLRYNDCITEWYRLDAEGEVYLKTANHRSPLNLKHKYEVFRQKDSSLILRRQKSRSHR